MKWKSVFLSFVCLVVIFAILLNCTPVKVEATSIAGAAIAGKVAVDAVIVVAAILIALGITAGVSDSDWAELKAHVISDLTDAGFVDSNGKIHVFTCQGTDYFFSATHDLISAVRSSVFSGGYLTSDVIYSVQGFHGEVLSGPGSFPNALNSAASVNPEAFISCLSSLGVNHKTMVLACTDSSLYGFHFNAEGKLVYSTFKNPLGRANASLMGVYEIDTLELRSSSSGIRTVTNMGISDPYLHQDIYYSQYYAEKTSDFYVSDVAAFDFTGLPYFGTYDSLFSGKSIFCRFFIKKASDTVWSSELQNKALNPSDYSLTGVSYLSGSDIIWSDYSKVQIATPYDLTLQNVGNEDSDIALAYPIWSTGVITVPGLSVGSDKEEEYMYPLGMGTTLSSTEALSQTDVWAGYTTPSNSNANSSADSIVNVGASAFWGSLSGVLGDIFVPSEDYLTAKVDALASEFSFVGPVVNFARSIIDVLSAEQSEPPIIYIHLDDSRGSFNLGGTVPFIDMSWYAEFKPLGDTLLSSLLWVLFIWRLFRQLPGLISGMPGDFVYDGLQSLNVHLPSRSAENDVQRIRLRDKITREARKK